MQVFYISHPYTGDMVKNLRKAKEIKHKLQTMYPDICFVSPLDEFGEYVELSYPKVLALCLELLSRCDGIVLCEGWVESKGCNAEYAFALQRGLDVKYSYGAILTEGERD